MKRLLILEFHLLGDAVMSLPFVRAARERYEVFVFGLPAAAKAYELVLPGERIFRGEISGRRIGGISESGDFRRVRREVAALGAEVGVTVWADVRVHLLMKALGIGERVGFEMNERNYYASNLNWRRRNLRIGQAMQGAAKLAGVQPVTRALTRRDYEQHHMADWAQVGEALGLTLDYETPWLGGPGTEAVLPEKAREFFERNTGRKIWLLHPGAGRESKRWRHFQELVDTVLAPADVPLVVVDDPGAPAVRPRYANHLIWPMGPLAEFVGLAAHCDFMLCNDSAASHIGAALKKHVVAIFSSGSANWFAPWSERTVIESRNCEFRPCLDRCQQPRFICLEDLPLGRVAEKVAALI